MSPIVRRLLALGAAGVAAVATFVSFSWFRLGFIPLAALALVAFWAVAMPLLRRATSDAGDAALARQSGRRWLVAGTTIYVLLAQWLVGFRPPRQYVMPEPVPGTQYWTLANGSRLAWMRTPARAPRHKAPVLVLHDGPGRPLLPMLQRLTTRPFDFLADEGFDVFYYDQRGAGLSSRIDLANDPPYSVAGHVEDIEEIRRTLGVSQLVLVGEGWGATLGTQYLVSHPDRVQSMVLESPDPLRYAEWPNYVAPAARARITDVQASLLAILGRPSPRLVLGRMMSDFNSRVAHAIVPDWEADQWWTRYQEELLRTGQPKVSCASDTPERLLPLTGLGFFSYSYTLRDAARLADPRPALSRVRVPVLIVRGSCDYVDWHVSYEYLRAVPGARYVAIPAAGHLVWLDQPTLHMDVLRAFFRGEPLPLAFYDPGQGIPP